MKVETKLENGILTLAPDGRVDTLTAPQLEAAVTYDGVSAMVFDFAKTDYISSAGLRVLVRVAKRLPGKVTVANAVETVREVFDVVGFTDAFTFV